MARRKKDLVKWIGIAIFVLVAVVSYLKAEHPDVLQIGTVSGENKGVVDFIDCGQGDSALILSEGEVVLIDAGTGSETEEIISRLKDRGVKTINHFVLTHPHEDHIGGAKEILETFEVENIYMKRPTKGTEPTSAVYINLLKEIQRQGNTVINAEVGKTFSCGTFEFSILGPLEEYKDLNAQSVVVRAEYEDCSFLFTGDMEKDAEEDLVEYYGSALDSTVLKVGHHGSDTSSCAAFLSAVSPQIAVISCGEDNSYGHPHDEALQRLEEQKAKVYRTDLSGTITVYTDGNKVEVQEAV